MFGSERWYCWCRGSEELSIILFDFGSTIGSAGSQIKAMGTEISLFCAVLKQLHGMLTKAKAFRYSISAIQATEDILKECRKIFEEIEAILEGLQKQASKSSQSTGSESSVDFIARVKWTFKRTQVQFLRSTLESCKNTLHIMLITLDIAQKVASRRYLLPCQTSFFDVSKCVLGSRLSRRILKTNTIEH